MINNNDITRFIRDLNDKAKKELEEMENLFLGFTTNEGTTNKYISFEDVKEITFTYQRECEAKEGERRKAKAEIYFKNSDIVHKVKGTFEFIHEIEYQFSTLTNPVKI